MGGGNVEVTRILVGEQRHFPPPRAEGCGMGRISSHSLPWPSTQHSTPSPCLPSSICNASTAFPGEKLPANTSTLLTELGEKGPEEPEQISHVEMQRGDGAGRAVLLHAEHPFPSQGIIKGFAPGNK